MTELKIERFTWSGIFSFKFNLENSEVSDMNPKVVTSIVLLDKLNRENCGNKFWFKLLYFDFLNCFAVTAFDSWQIVNSRVDIVLLCLMAMSGRSEMNRVESGLYEGSSR